MEELQNDRVSPQEMETIIIWNEAEKAAEIYTASPKVRARLEKAGLKPYREDGYGVYFTVPRKAIRLKLAREAVYIAGGVG